MRDIRAALITGIDIPIPECQLTLHQPTMTEWSYLGEDNLFPGIQTLTVEKYMFQDKTNLENTSNFQIFMMIMTDKQSIEKKNQVIDVLQLLFPQYNIILMPRSLVFRKDTETFMVDENNFENMQEVIAQVCCAKGGKENQAFNAKDQKSQEIARKLMRGRSRVAAQKAAQGGGPGSLFQRYISSIAIGLQLSIKEVSQYTMFQLYDQIERFGLYTHWDIDIRSRLAGATPKEKPNDWMENIH